MKSYKNLVLVIWTSIIIIANVITFMTAEVTTSNHYDLKIEAANLMAECSEVIKEKKIELGYDVETEDINETGLIGTRYTLITTTLGILESKRTSTNPNFAAVIVDMLIQAGVKEGDYVGVTFSGSFPALNIAVSSAIEVLKLNPVIMASIGSSSYGANNPDFTYVDMAQVLYEEGYFSFDIDYVSFGGSNDTGEDMPEEVKLEIKNRMLSLNKVFIEETNFQKNINYRKKIFLNNDKKMKAFINVGGNLVAMGDEQASFPNKNGLITKRNITYSKDMGLMDIFLNQNVPVIHVLDIKRLAIRYGLPYDPHYMPLVGEGDIYFQKTYNIVIPLISILVSIFILIFYKFYEKYLD